MQTRCGNNNNNNNDYDDNNTRNDNNKTVRTDNGRGGRRVYNDGRDAEPYNLSVTVFPVSPTRPLASAPPRESYARTSPQASVSAKARTGKAKTTRLHARNSCMSLRRAGLQGKPGDGRVNNPPDLFPQYYYRVVVYIARNISRKKNI